MMWLEILIIWLALASRIPNTRGNSNSKAACSWETQEYPSNLFYGLSLPMEKFSM